MATLAEDLMELLPLAGELRTATPHAPVLFAIPLPNGPGTDRFAFPSLVGKRSFTVSWLPDGTVRCEGQDQAPFRFDIEVHAHARCQALVGGRVCWFGLIAVSEDKRDKRRAGWNSWKTLAARLAGKLLRHPESAAGEHPSGSGAALAFVFRSVLNTELASEHDGFLAIEKLWWATLRALAHPYCTTVATPSENSANVRRRGPKRLPRTKREETLLGMYDKGWRTQFKSFYEIAEAAGHGWDAVTAEKFIRRVKRQRERDRK